MYAIVEIAGQQFKVVKDQKVYVHRLQGEAGDNLTFSNVLLVDNGTVTIGAPAVKGAAVTAKILNHLQGDKVIVFKKKRRKGYRVKNGHRQALTEILIEGITETGAKKAPVKKAVEVKEEAGSADLSSKTVAELKAMAKEQGITGYTSLKKAELIEALTK